LPPPIPPFPPPPDPPYATYAAVAAPPTHAAPSATLPALPGSSPSPAARRRHSRRLDRKEFPPTASHLTHRSTRVFRDSVSLRRGIGVNGWVRGAMQDGGAGAAETAIALGTRVRRNPSTGGDDRRRFGAVPKTTRKDDDDANDARRAPTPPSCRAAMPPGTADTHRLIATTTGIAVVAVPRARCTRASKCNHVRARRRVRTICRKVRGEINADLIVFVSSKKSISHVCANSVDIWEITRHAICVPDKSHQTSAGRHSLARRSS
jgi:hypothetical protein